MTTETAKKNTKPKVGKAPAEKPIEKKAEASKPETKKPAVKKPEGKAAVSGKKIKLTQTTGTIARKWDQEATLRGLGLGKRHRSRILLDTPEIRGMVYKVRHLITVEEA